MSGKSYQIKQDAQALFGAESEMFSEDPNPIAQEEQESADFVEIVLDIRSVYDMLSQVDALIEEEKKTYGLDHMDRERMESLYTYKMDAFFNLSYAFHPFTSYGRECIQKAIEVRKEYESLGECLSTRVGPGNISVFEPLLTEDLAEDILTGRRLAIGAIRSIEEKAKRSGDYRILARHSARGGGSAASDRVAVCA